MDIYTFYNTFITALAADAAIETWANTQFGKSLKVYADLSGGELPAADDMPYLILHTPEVSRHQERMEQSYKIACDIALTKDGLAARAEKNVVEPQGIELISDLVELLVDCIEFALPANTVMGFDLLADTLGSLPEVYGFMEINFTQRITIGSDPLT